MPVVVNNLGMNCHPFFTWRRGSGPGALGFEYRARGAAGKVPAPMDGRSKKLKPSPARLAVCIGVGSCLVWCGTAVAAAPPERFQLPPMPLSQLGNPHVTDAVLERAQREGLRFTDRPSLGSGLARWGENEFVGITDRGPTGTIGVKDKQFRTFPLPEFCPTLMRFKLEAGEIRITRCIPLRDAQGQLLPGRGPHHQPAGLDPEAVRVFPDGKFLLGDEAAPSLAVVSAAGEVLMRYTPRPPGHAGSSYPVMPILPEIFRHRRQNRGFENVALSRDGRTAYAILQSPLGDEQDARYQNSRWLRVLKLDFTVPLAARVTGEFLAPVSAARDYGKKQAQEKILWSDADCVGVDRLLVIERGKDAARLLLVDLSNATDILSHPLEAGLRFEAATEPELNNLGVRLAGVSVVDTIRELPGVRHLKLEGLVALDAQTVLLAHDNDFGGDNPKTSTVSTVWRLKLSQPIPDFR